MLDKGVWEPSGTTLNRMIQHINKEVDSCLIRFYCPDSVSSM